MVLANAINACPDEPFCQMCTSSPPHPDVQVCGRCYHSIFNEKTKKCDKNIPSKVENCASYRQVGDEFLCDVCELGYSLNSNTCIKCKVSNCARCLYGESCFNCFNGLMPTFVKGEVVCSNIEKCSVANCDVCNSFMDSKPGCALCNQGFALLLDINICVRAPDNCYWTLPSSNGCEMCRDGFYMTSDKKCKPNPAETPLTSPILAHPRVKTTHRSSTSAMPL